MTSFIIGFVSATSFWLAVLYLIGYAAVQDSVERERH
jgi:hypothetical protein